MMVIQGTVGTNTVIIPAENCSWRITDIADGGPGERANGYRITNAETNHGVGSGNIQGVAFTGGAPTPIANALFGYIGKTGRFVALSQA